MVSRAIVVVVFQVNMARGLTSYLVTRPGSHALLSPPSGATNCIKRGSPRERVREAQGRSATQGGERFGMSCGLEWEIELGEDNPGRVA